MQNNSKRALIWIVTILFIAFYFLIIPSFKTSKPTTTKAVAVQPKSNVHQPQWDGVGVTPIGVWSKTFKVNPGCKIRYNAGNGSLFKVRYRFYSNKWIDHVPGTCTKASEVQFMVLKKDVTEIPFTITCK